MNLRCDETSARGVLPGRDATQERNPGLFTGNPLNDSNDRFDPRQTLFGVNLQTGFLRHCLHPSSAPVLMMASQVYMQHNHPSNITQSRAGLSGPAQDAMTLHSCAGPSSPPRIPNLRTDGVCGDWWPCPCRSCRVIPQRLRQRWSDRGRNTAIE